MAKWTKRQKPDEFTNYPNYGNQIADGIHHAIKPLDQIANRMELKYGCDRLPALVSCETAQRFGSAKAKLDKAIDDNDADAVAKKAAVMIKGWQKMDQEAAAAGHKALSPNIWSYTTQQGFKFAVAEGNADAIKSIRTDPAMEGVAVYSLEEIGRVLEAEKMTFIRLAKDSFPTAKVEDVRSKKDKFDDEIPF
tara:strand:- start:1391 stop:1969 length:579 start_codon:yes stop_codon:yes gene_type:complete